MFGKFFAALLLVGATVAVGAAEIISLDLNFYTEEDSSVKVVGKLPPGVTMPKRVKFSNPKLKGYAYRIRINLAKAKSVDLKFVVTGRGRICPSLSGCTSGAKGKATGKFTYTCTKFDFCDEPTTRKLPFRVVKWTNMYPRGIDVSDGEVITVVAEFEK